MGRRRFARRLKTAKEIFSFHFDLGMDILANHDLQLFQYMKKSSPQQKRDIAKLEKLVARRLAEMERRGIPAAEALTDESYAKWCEVEKAVLLTQPTTFPGVVAKLAFIRGYIERGGGGRTVSPQCEAGSLYQAADRGRRPCSIATRTSARRLPRMREPTRRVSTDWATVPGTRQTIRLVLG